MPSDSEAMYCERRLYSEARVAVRVRKVTPQNCLNYAKFGKASWLVGLPTCLLCYLMK